MYEVELKVQSDHDQIRDHLELQNATYLETVEQVDTYYNAPDRNFVETDEALRIREQTVLDEGRGTQTIVLTYKGPLIEEQSKTREEAETEVGDKRAMHSILEGLGYQPVPAVRKTREKYQLRSCTVSLDTVEDIGEFVEVEHRQNEGEVKRDAVERARIEVQEIIEDLGLSPDEQIRRSYLGLVIESRET